MVTKKNRYTYILLFICIQFFTHSCTCLDDNDEVFMRKVSLNTNDTVYHTLVLQPGAEGKDACISTGSWADINRGNDKEFDILTWTRSGTIGYYRSVIDFDFSSIASGSIIKKASLSLFHNPTATMSDGLHSSASAHLSGKDNGAYLRRIISTWEENTITWATQPTITTINEVLLPASTSGTQDYLDIDVTALVQDIIDNRNTSFGFMIMLQKEEVYRSLIFASSDHPDATKHPKLVVEYYEIK